RRRMCSAGRGAGPGRDARCRRQAGDDYGRSARFPIGNCGPLHAPAIVPSPVPQALSSADPFQVLGAPGGVEIHLLATSRFRTTVVQWIAEAPLDGARAARALLPDLLTRGTRRSPGLAAMAARCEELFAAE